MNGFLQNQDYHMIKRKNIKFILILNEHRKDSDGCMIYANLCKLRHQLCRRGLGGICKDQPCSKLCHLPACFSLESNSDQMAGIRKEETTLLELSPSSLI